MSPIANFLAVGFGDGRAHPGVVEIDDGDDRRSDIHYFAFARRTNGNDAANWRDHFGIRETRIGFGDLRSRGVCLSAHGVNGVNRRGGLVHARFGGSEVRLGRLYLLFKRVDTGLRLLQRGNGTVAILRGSDAGLRQFDSAVSIELLAIKIGLRFDQLRLRRLDARLRAEHVVGRIALGGDLGVLRFAYA